MRRRISGCCGPRWLRRERAGAADRCSDRGRSTRRRSDGSRNDRSRNNRDHNAASAFSPGGGSTRSPRLSGRTVACAIVSFVSPGRLFCQPMVLVHSAPRMMFEARCGFRRGSGPRVTIDSAPRPPTSSVGAIMHHTALTANRPTRQANKSGTCSSCCLRMEGGSTTQLR